MIARSRGFTMLELMIVLVIVAILVSVAAPSFREVIARSRMKTAASDLHHSLMFARSEAVKRNAAVAVQPVSGADWSQGWSVQVQASALVLQRQDSYPNVTFSTRNTANTVVSPLASVVFSGNGRETGSGGAGISFVLTATSFSGVQARCVALAPSGRPAVRTDRNADPTDGCN